MALKQAGVDNGAPFRSVKEAVAAYPDLVTGSSNSRKPGSPAKLDIAGSPISPLPPSSSSGFPFVPGRDELRVVDTLRKLEAELEETKRELKQLKEMQTETTVAVAALRLRLRNSTPKPAESNAVVVGESAPAIQEQPCSLQIDWRREGSLAHAFRFERIEDEFGGRGEIKGLKKKKKKKSKPIITLIGEIIGKKTNVVI